MTLDKLQAEFHAAMLALAEAAKEYDSTAAEFGKKVEKEGAMALARRLLDDSAVKDGLLRPWEVGRLENSVEALVLDERFAALFSEKEKGIAQGRLDALKNINPVRELLTFEDPDSSRTYAELAARFSAALQLNLEESKEFVRADVALAKRAAQEGGLELAREIIHQEGEQIGLLYLWQSKRLDLSLEALILQKQFRPLFTGQEILLCRTRLDTLGYTPKR